MVLPVQGSVTSTQNVNIICCRTDFEEGRGLCVFPFLYDMSRAVLIVMKGTGDGTR